MYVGCVEKGESSLGYDIIGDIHGHAGQLEKLLNQLGYQHNYGTYRHPERTAIFVGDFIDRGPEQLRTLHIVRKMVDEGTALAVMGNHELNAVAWHTPDPNKRGEFLRPHFCPRKGEKNRSQHGKFLAEVENDPSLHSEIIEWFLGLPLWLDLPQFRVIHACWHDSCINYLTPHLLNGNRLHRDIIQASTVEPTDENERAASELSIYAAVETLTKGPEVRLPQGYSFTDKDGHIRHHVRTRWWDHKARNYRQAALLDEAEREQLPVAPIPGYSCSDHMPVKPVFFGHYWFTGTPSPLTSHFACLDYSVAKDGKLCAYRWQGETELIDSHFFWIDHSIA